MNIKRFGEMVRDARGEQSLREFASRCGISHTHLDSIEKGVDPRTGKEVSVSIDTLEKISKGIGIDVISIINDTTPSPLGVSLDDLNSKINLLLFELESHEVTKAYIETIMLIRHLFNDYLHYKKSENKSSGASDFSTDRYLVFKKEINRDIDILLQNLHQSVFPDSTIPNSSND